MTKIHALKAIGQSIWLDYIDRQLLTTGGLEDMVKKGVTGVTTNPSIFQQAITHSQDYDQDIALFTQMGMSAQNVYESLVLSDIMEAADILRPVYEETDGVDGFVSLEVNPRLAHNPEGTFQEAARLFTALERPNVMIKVPATAAGVEAGERLIAAGIPINFTLIFSVKQYVRTLKAFLNGVQKLSEYGPVIPFGLEADRIASVASLFISRTDTALDPVFLEHDKNYLEGIAAITVAKKAYACFLEMLAGPVWQDLSEKGVHAQRLLWASTSAKNPNLPDTYYVDELIAPDTVNTVPPKTLNAFMENGKTEQSISADSDVVELTLMEIQSLGLNIEKLAQELQDNGLVAFASAHTSLLDSIKSKQEMYMEQRISA